MQNFEISSGRSENFYSPSYSNSQNSNNSIMSVVSKIFEGIARFFSGIATSIGNFFFGNSSSTHYVYVEPSAPPLEGYFDGLPVARTVALEASNDRPYQEHV